jgi:hypothetical protein
MGNGSLDNSRLPITHDPLPKYQFWHLFFFF